jgi:CheY-like chemotaxis protein
MISKFLWVLNTVRHKTQAILVHNRDTIVINHEELIMLRVLYIDDDEINRDIVKRILARAPYEVKLEEAVDGQEGVDMAHDMKPDLILMDFHMPGMPGPEATRLIRADESTSKIPILALTADIYARGTFEAAGCNGYLTKPIRKRSLLHAIEGLFPELPQS